MIDEYKGQQGVTAPIVSGEAVVPDDTADLSYATRAIYVGTAGDLSVELISGDVITLRNVQASVLYPLRIKRVMATNTTASDLVALR